MQKAPSFRSDYVKPLLLAGLILAVFSSKVIAQTLVPSTCPSQFSVLLTRPKVEPTSMQFGEVITLVVGQNKKPVDTYFIGKTMAADGPETLLFDPVSNTRYHISDRAVRWGRSTEKVSTKSPATEHWYAETPKNKDATCSAHAQANCMIQLNPGLATLFEEGLSETIQKEREEIYGAARDFLYAKNRSTADFIEDFALRSGFSARTFASSQKGYEEAVFQHLKDGKPVVMTFMSALDRSGQYVSKVGTNGSATAKSEYVFRQYQMPTRDREARSAHAILLLRVLEVPGHEKMVLVQDSSGDGLRLVAWSELNLAPPGKPSHYVLVDRAGSGPRPDHHSSLITEIERDQKPVLAKLAASEPKAFREILPANLFDGSLPEDSWVVVRRRAATLQDGESAIVSGRVVRSGTALDGHSRYLEIDPTSNRNALGSELEIVFENTVESASQYAPNRKEWNETLRTAKIGDRVQIVHRPSLSSEARPIEGTVVFRHLEDSKDPSRQRIDVLDSKTKTVLTLDSRELVSSATKTSSSSATNASNAIRDSLIDKFAGDFRKIDLAAEFAIKKAAAFSSVAYPRVDHVGFDVELMNGKKLLIKLSGGRIIEGSNSFEATLVSGRADEIVVATHGSNFRISADQVEGVLAFHSADKPATPLIEILDRSVESNYIYHEKSDLPRAKAALKGAIALEGSDALPNFIKQAKLGDAIAVEIQDSPLERVHQVTGRVIAAGDGQQVLVWSDAAGEVINIKSGGLVRSIYAKPEKLKWQRVEVNAESSNWRMLAEKSVNHYGLVNLRTSNQSKVLVYGAIKIEEIKGELRMTVTDSNGVVHTFDRALVSKMDVQLVEKTDSTRDLWAFPTRAPHNFTNAR